ncbi:hypothetical protein QJS66_23475 (plasmid) [Kocuria rhizophila]|nr:hypothetical protein QJS66_23475 [Kocuria rhizophila]
MALYSMHEAHMEPRAGSGQGRLPALLEWLIGFVDAAGPGQAPAAVDAAAKGHSGGSSRSATPSTPLDCLRVVELLSRTRHPRR